MTLERKTPLRAKTALKRRTPLRAVASLKRTSIRRRSARPRKKRKGPERSEAFLAFVRRKPCLVTGCRQQSQAHHWGKRGKGQKCSDFKTAPLCHEHHIEGWHRHGTLPGRTRAEWMELFRENAIAMREEFEGLAATAAA